MSPRVAAWLALLIALLAWPAWATAQAQRVAGDELEISLVTYGPGEIYWERFGHNALVVRDRERATAISYNYGMFDFDEDDFFVNFLRGHMTYQIAGFDFEREWPLYVDDGRSVQQQVLALDATQKQQLADFLADNAQPQNAAYRYDYFVSNCSTKVRDALDQVLGGAIRRQSEGRSRGYTFRMDALRLTAPDRWLMLLIDAGLGPYADQRLDYWRESFVPMTLADVVDATRLANGQPLVASRRLLAPSRVAEPLPLPPQLRTAFASIGLGIGVLLLFLHARRRHRAARMAFAGIAGTLSLLFSIGGLVLAGLWAFTEHQSAWRNENLLLFNPLCLLLLPTWLRALRADWQPSPRMQVVAWLVLLCAAVALFCKVLPSFVQANLHWILLVLPIHLALARSARLAGTESSPATP